MKLIQRGLLLSALVGLVLLFGCGGGGDSITSGNAGSTDTDGSSTAGTGTLSISLTDASTINYLAIYVTIDEVRVHKQGSPAGNTGWVTVATPKQTYNLLQLVNGLTAILGEKELEAAPYSQIRLMLGSVPESATNILGEPHPYANYIILNDGQNTIEPLKIPSGFRSGIKLVHRFDVLADEVVELILDFDACRSIVVTGSGKYRLKPRIKVIGTVGKSLVYGHVTTFDSTIPLPGALITAQIPDNLSVKVVRSTLTSGDSADEGRYRLTLSPGQTYRIVAYANQKVETIDGEEMFLPACSNLTVPDDGSTKLNFALDQTAYGTILGAVSLQGDSGDDDAPVVYMNFYRMLACGYAEIASLPMSFDEDSDTLEFSIDLPLGTYDVVASGEGMTPDTASAIELTTSGEAVEVSLRLFSP